MHSGGGSPMSNSTPVKNGLIPAVVQMRSRVHAWFVSN